MYVTYFSQDNGWWDEKEDQVLRDKERINVLEAMEAAETADKPPSSEMFTDVYAQMPTHLREQRDEMMEHVKKYPEHYDLDQH